MPSAVAQCNKEANDINRTTLSKTVDLLGIICVFDNLEAAQFLGVNAIDAAIMLLSMEVDVSVSAALHFNPEK